MITTLRDSKAHLSELVERASRVTRVEDTFDAKDRKAWLRELRAIQRKHTVSQRTSIDAIPAEVREDRL